jgi:predicted acylesterase/phospholipase RssA
VKTFGELGGENPLRVVGTDLAHERMVVFPEDAVLYLDGNGQPYEPEEFLIADAVRISAGYPYFFPPVTLKDAATGKDGALVDGGVVSAYPVFLFDKEQPQHPTWGFGLFGGGPREKAPYQPIHGPAWPIDIPLRLRARCRGKNSSRANPTRATSSARHRRRARCRNEARTRPAPAQARSWRVIAFVQRPVGQRLASSHTSRTFCG